jgi:hypothetical protein
MNTKTLFALFLMAAPLFAQLSSNVSVFATGLDNPRGLRFGKDNKLYVVEAGVAGSQSTVGLCDQFTPPIGPSTSGYTARITRLGPNGQKTIYKQGLYSFAQDPASGAEINGVSDLNFDNNDVLALVLGGCQTGSPTQKSEVIRIRPNGQVSQVVNLSAWYRANPPVNRDNFFNADGVPYRIVRDKSNFYIVEANHSVLDRLNSNGTMTRVADFSAIFPGGFDFTPSALAIGPDDALYVGTFGAFPYPAGGAKILRVTKTGSVSVFAENLNLIQGIEFDCAGRMYVLEAATPGFFFPDGTGRVLRRDGTSFTVVASGLTRPAGMTLGEDGKLYVSNNGFGVGPVPGRGQIVVIDLGLGKQKCQ